MKAAGYWSGRTTLTAPETLESLSAGDPLALKTDGFFGDAKGLERQWEETRGKEGAVFYFWGHSWQIGKTDEQWQKFDDFVAKFAHQPDAWYPSQGELYLWIWSRKNVRLTVKDKPPGRVVIEVSRPWLHPYLSARRPLNLKLPAGVRKVVWQGKEVTPVGGFVTLNWPTP